MPIVKHIAVHVSPKVFLKYILNGDKNADMTYASGLNCDVKSCYKAFKKNFEHFSGERFFKPSTIFQDEESKQKEAIRCHHYIQSFKPGETTPEEAHEIGVKWAKEVFGENRNVVVSTHIDRGHIHNHVAVAPFDNEGVRWYGNKKSLKHIRNVSDRIAKEYGLSVIENADKCRNNRTYAEMIARRQGNSWKDKMRNDIDRLVCSPNVNNLDDLIGEMESLGYTVTRHKYISIKSPKAKNAIRSFRLGDGYALEHLEYRIRNKDIEMSLDDVQKYTGVQREYALMIRQMQITLYRHISYPKRVMYREVCQRMDLLNYISQNNIRSENDFADMVNQRDEEYRKLTEEKNRIDDEISNLTKVLTDGQRYLELMNKDDLSADEIDELGKYEYMHDYDVQSEIDLEVFKARLVELGNESEKAEERIHWAKQERDDTANLYKTFLEEKQEDKYFYDIAQANSTSDTQRIISVGEHENNNIANKQIYDR